MAALLCAIFCAVPAAAQAPATTIAQMRARDPFNVPAEELAAWQAYNRLVEADPAATPLQRAEALEGLAIAQYYIRDFAAAEKLTNRAAELAGPQLPSLDWGSELQSYRAAILGELGKDAEARALAKTALALATARHGADSAPAALATQVKAVLDFGSSDYAEAARGMCLAADMARRHLPPEDGMVVNNLSSCAATLYFADDDRAIPAAQEAAAFALAHLRPGSTRLGLALNNAAGVLMRMGRWKDCEDIARRSVEAYRAVAGADDPEQASAMTLLGKALLEQGKLGPAEAILRETMALAERLPLASDPSRPGKAKLLVAQVQARQGRVTEAMDWATRAIEQLRRDAPNHADIANGLRQRAEFRLRLGELPAALDDARTAAADLEKRHGPTHRDAIAARLTEAHVLAEAGRAGEGLALARPAAEALATRMFDLAASRTERIALVPTLRAGFAQAAFVALRAGDEEAALRFAQLASLSELALANAQLAAAAGAADPKVATLLDEVRRREVEARGFDKALAARDKAPAELERLGREASANAAALAELEARLARDHPDLASLERPRVETLAELQARLGPDQALVIPLVLDNRTITLAVDARGLAQAESALDRPAFQAALAAVQASLDPATNRPFAAAESARLAAAVLPPALRMRLAGAGVWRFAANGPLAALPPAVLLTRAPKPGEPLDKLPWLLREKALAVDAPGAPRQRGGRSQIGIGAPVIAPALLASGIRDLPGAAAELDALRTLAPDRTQVLAGAEVTAERVRTLDFAQAAVLLFATHGLGAGEAPGLDEPALLLGADAGKADPSFLTAGQIAGLNIPVDFVILSACSSAGASEPGASAFSGLVRAFRLAGAGTLMVSHWRVRDDVARRLTGDVLRRSGAGVGRAQALRAAQLELLADRRVSGAAHPAQWAPFVIVGE